jgi:alpha-beta hydrolase superfamily lysophospholipase
MKHHEGIFNGVRDLKVFYQILQPEGNTKAAILIVHGLGEHSGRYMNVVDHLVPLGYALYGFDLIGHGKSEGERAFIEQYEDFSVTLMAYYKMVKAEQPDKPIFLLGHSMGGLIVTEYLTDHSDDFRGAVISAPSIMIPDFVTPFTVTAFKFLSQITPKVGVLALDPNGVSRDPAVVQAYINDPLVFHGKTSARLGAELLQAIIRVNDEMERITAPLMIVHGRDDKLANPKASQLLYDRASSVDKTLKIYDGLHHEVFNEPEHEQVLGEVAAWLDAHL